MMSDLFHADTIARVQRENAARITIETKARDGALEQVSKTNSAWMSLFLAVLCETAEKHAGQERTGEAIRQELRTDGLMPPLHPNAWGAAINTAVRRGILLDTGLVVKMTSPGSHARRTPVYSLQAREHWKVL